jgi:WD40 repeat protein
VFAAGDYGKIVIWDAATGELARTLEPKIKGTPLYAAAISPKGNVLATGIGRRLWESGPDGQVNVWDLVSGQRLHNLRGHVASITALAFSADGRTLVSGSCDGSVILWDLTPGRTRLRFKGKTSLATTKSKTT